MLKSYKKANNLAGALVFGLALTTYLLTLEPTVSFWDCGEFIASANKLLVPHPPGAPTFLLLGRLVSLLAGSPAQVAAWVNGLSALSSSFTVLFLFWTITMLAHKLVLRGADYTQQPTASQTLQILGAGLVGALAFTFSDSFWFNAVEAEVYAMSSLCTAVVVWLMLKWESRATEPDSDKWLILIAYVIGLSIGVHLLNLLALPALGLLYYFRKTARPTTRGSLLALGLSGALVLAILLGIIPGLPSVAGDFEVFFVNSVGLPFNSGVVLFLLLLVGSIGAGFWLARRTGRVRLHTALLSLVFILIGYSTYLIVPIRSGFNPALDENNPEDVLSFVSYLKREQYGSRPLLYGPQFNAQPVDQQQGAPRYERSHDAQGHDTYVVAERRLETTYSDQDKMLLPRLYSNQPGHVRAYQNWVNVQPDQKPTMAQNLAFLVNYQLGHMYWRYFLWNFVGRESDVQQAGVLWPGSSKNGLPAELANNPARNNFYALPLVLGLLGLFFQVKRDGRNALVVGLLFVLTGLAIVLYLNQPPTEPRERDYTFAGSFYAFAIWIGLGVLALHELLRYALRPERLRLVVAPLLALAVPAIMATQGWDDHNRSNRYAALDWAKNMLRSVAPNAILITYADNDTFPLWYAQNVENFRPDVRVAVLSYLNTDWYVDQMKQPANQSKPWPLSLAHKDYSQGTNDYLPYVENPAVSALNVKEFLQLVKQNSPLLQVQTQSGKSLLSYPTTNFYLDVDTAAVRRLGIIPKARKQQVVARMSWQASKEALEKNTLVILDLLATNDWQRPVYLSTSIPEQDYAGLDQYLQLEGLAYRVLPAQNPQVQPREVGTVSTELLFDSLMRKFSYRNLNRPGVYYDETIRRTTGQYREQFARLSQAYLRAGETAKARQVVEHCLRVMPDDTIPFDYNNADLIAPLVKLGQQKRAHALFDLLTDRTQQSLAYYSQHEPGVFEREIGVNLLTLQHLYQAAADTNDRARAARVAALAEQYYPRS
ncbi:glycosyltransferase family 117 protein [Hymenobacter chitinivorans]|uniref:Uncharacterized protein DUF2723 n=1 Tax=Hymenobacter chitinivorans DSM 11115 TaxID=1121954 RepID=A0A2M9BLL1_9BACT|nr:DUF2723 domain-containing protein [Hymenobacter chitinivorans]PJJ58815.1 uncharacterized protein DUF2723 [Hymenobacter chitinivorans DSM 11115]